ncbi:MAG: RluA family pseudouridine synthase [Treponema sp.]|jgi:RluA family pseudouridine synthase|nr:RluA family pseudouridine synthase [Treponema sp.]
MPPPVSPQRNTGKPERRLARGILLLYEDRDLLVLDKPAGLLSIASGTEREKTVYWVLAEYLRGKGGKQRPAVVHRLDRDTSGLMVFAKSERIKKKLMENWDRAVTVRRYIALAEGDFSRHGRGGTGVETDEGIIDEPLGEDGGGRVIVKPGGRRALTRWKLLDRGKGYSLLSLDLETGRRNQIRAHLLFLGCPVAGDKKYGARTDPLGRLALHAETLCFYHPAGGQLMEFVSPAFSVLVKQRLGLSRTGDLSVKQP